MAKVIFTYDKVFITIECGVNEKIKDICQRYLSKTEMLLLKVSFIYNNNKIDEELTFEQLANETDKERKTINIIVEVEKKPDTHIIIIDEAEKKLNDYKNKINYNFVKNPNLTYKYDIIDTNENYGMNDIFEVFISYKDNKEYIVSPNINHNLDIFELLENKIIKSIEGHESKITTVRYFINKKDNNEYLISAEKNKTVIIVDITNNYNIKYKIDTNYNKNIYSCLLVFPHDNEENFIIISTSSDNNESFSKVYSLNNGAYVKYLNNSNIYKIWYLLSWYNKKENKYYIIQLANKKIIINNLMEEDIYWELIKEVEHNHYSGFIYNKDEIDYLCTSSQNGYINIWDLYNKKIFKIINTNKCQLLHIIQWNNRYIIVADSFGHSFKIIDLEQNKVISEIKDQNANNVICIKKMNHPVLGESLFSACACKDKAIKLWSL